MADMNINDAKARLAASKQLYNDTIAAAAAIHDRDKIQYCVDEWICNGDDAAELDLQNKQLTELPDNLPDNLQKINCYCLWLLIVFLYSERDRSSNRTAVSSIDRCFCLETFPEEIRLWIKAGAIKSWMEEEQDEWVLYTEWNVIGEQ